MRSTDHLVSPGIAMRYILAVACFNFEFEALSGKPNNCWPGSSQDLLPIKIKSLMASKKEDVKDI